MVAKAGVTADLDELASLPEKEVITTGGKRRVDPQPAPLDGVLSQGVIANKDKGKHYVWVNRANDPTFNIGSYLSLGYKLERFHKDDPDQARPTLGWQEYEDGALIESMGCVLVSCSKEHKAMLDARGQAHVDKIQQTIRRGSVDPLSANEQAMYKDINFERHGDDNRPSWEF